jgi:hypothetical protein
MNSKRLLCAVLFAAGVCFSAAIPALADDSAASIAAGGLVPRRENRIVMAKEVLRISPTKIVVDYDFRNDSDQDVTTEVAFPIPPYQNEWAEGDLAEQAFRSFKVWVDEKPIEYKAEAKAILKGRDISATLNARHIDIATYGHFQFVNQEGHNEEEIEAPDFAHLSNAEKQSLVKQGILAGMDDYGQWTVNLQYHWAQNFPAHSTVHIRHEYTPSDGFQAIPLDAFRNTLLHKKPVGNDYESKDQRENLKLLDGFCPDPSLLRASIRAIADSDPENGQYLSPEWVDFILTSANTWKQPIEDFTLIVERGKPLDGYGKPEEREHYLVSFCTPQNALVEKLDADHFQVHLTNFIPTSELRIGFFDLPEAKPASKK